MLKKYVGFGSFFVSPLIEAHVVIAAGSLPAYSLSEDRLNDRRSSVSGDQHLPNSARSDIIRPIKRNPSQFGNVPSRTNVLKHDIDVGEHRPIKQHAYRVHPDNRVVMQQEVNSSTTVLLSQASSPVPSSPWSSPSLLVPKSDQMPHFCMDFRKVNAVTKTATRWDLPNMLPSSTYSKVIGRLHSLCVPLKSVFSLLLIIFFSTQSCHSD